MPLISLAVFTMPVLFLLQPCLPLIFARPALLVHMMDGENGDWAA